MNRVSVTFQYEQGIQMYTIILKNDFQTSVATSKKTIVYPPKTLDAACHG